MSKKTKIDEDVPIGKLTRVKDFLPPPDQLVLPQEEVTKVTIALNRSSVIFFKRQAKKHNTKYQRMIRQVLDRYASQYKAS